jgi:alkylation response protein AidB-like acyl-CoA dehydrogenase
VDLTFSPEQELLRDSAAKVLAEHWFAPLTDSLQSGEPADEGPLWDLMAELGWTRLGLPAECGGEGSLLDAAIVVEQIGQTLAPTRLRSAITAARLIAQAGGPDQLARLLTPLAAGERSATVALHEPSVEMNRDAMQATTAPAIGAVVVTGTKTFVPDAGDATTIIVIADQGRTAVAVPSESPGLRVSSLGTSKRDRQYAVHLQDCVVEPALVLGERGQAGTAISQALLEAVALLAVEMVGGAQATLDRTVAYVRSRHQFGRPIGSFQAVGHQLADAATSVDAARLAAFRAVTQLADGSPAATATAIAKVAAGSAYTDTTLVAHQLHGGVGYTTDGPLYLWTESAKAAELTLGTPVFHLGSIADSVLAEH